MSEEIMICRSEANVPVPAAPENLFFDLGKFAQMQSMASIMASSECTIPNHLKGKTGDCFAIIVQSVQWGMNPYAVAQKTHIVSGTLGYEAQLVNAVVNSLAPTRDRIHYEWFGPWENILGKFQWRDGKNGKFQAPGWRPEDEAGCGVKVWATLKGENEPRELTLLLAQATVRNSTLWASDPRQQLAYLAVKRWSRLFCPEVILGVYTPDELEGEEMKNITLPPPAGATATDRLKERLGLPTAPPPPEEEPPPSVLIGDAIAAGNAPVTVDIVVDYLKSVGLLGDYSLDDVNHWPPRWLKRLGENPAALVDLAADWHMKAAGASGELL